MPIICPEETPILDEKDLPKNWTIHIVNENKIIFKVIDEFYQGLLTIFAAEDPFDVSFYQTNLYGEALPLEYKYLKILIKIAKKAWFIKEEI